jgi:hypothetical protein
MGSPVGFFGGRRHIERSPQPVIIDQAAAAVKHGVMYACAASGADSRGQRRTQAGKGRGF